MRHRSARLVALAAATLLPLAAAEAAEAVVVPPGNAAVEGDAVEGTGTDLGGGIISGPSTVQFAYDSTYLTGLPAGTPILGFRFRREGSLIPVPTATTTYADFAVTVATPTLGAGLLAPTFAANEGVDATQVRGGPLTFTVDAFPGGSTPNPFGPVIPFATPYVYGGGDLLFTVRHTGADSGPSGVQGRTLDAEMAAGLRYQLAGPDGGGASATLATFSGGFAPVVDLVVPEPTTLTTLAAAAALLARRRRR